MPPTRGHGKICYIELPAADVQQSSAFYQKAFGWKLRRRGDGEIAFDDGVGEVSGTWVTGRKPFQEPGLLFYIMVDDIHAAIDSVVEAGGAIVQPRDPESREKIARFRDPGGNVVGLYEEPNGMSD